MNAATSNVNLLRLRAAGAAKWRTFSPRERVAAAIAFAIVAVALLWLVGIAPALRTVRSAPAALDRLDAQLSQMQRLAAEARELKTGPPVAAAQSAAALRSATERLGGRARLAVLGDRATLTLSGTTGDALRQWLAEARSGARARPVEATLTRGPQGYSGTVVVSFGGRIVKVGALPLRWPRRDQRHAPPATAGWAESTQAELAWKSSRGAAFRWGVAGAVIGTIVALIAFAPASWLASAVSGATNQTLLLADARGTIWNGSAVAVLTGGPDSRDAASLPGRLNWTIGWRRWFGMELRLTQACCLKQPLAMVLRPGFGRFSATLLPAPGGDAAARWPAAWLAGLGTPWNTLQLGGELRLASPGLTIERVQGRWRFDGRADIELADMASRVSTLAPLGSYRLSVAGDPAAPGAATVSLQTLEGALQLTGNGVWGPNGVRFRGEASAQPGDEAALANLLNIIGRRNGARSVISIG